MNEPLRLQIKNSFDAIPSANDAATNWLEAHAASPAATYLATLAIEELVTNCIKHGYDDNIEHEIEIHLSVEGRNMILAVIDDGHLFNPLDRAEPDTTLPIEDRPLGGLGIHLLRKMSDRMAYERRDEKNHVTIIKSIG